MKLRSPSSIATLTLLSFLFLPAFSAAPASSGSADIVELAIVLDTSDSMKPLIDATRLTLWDIVNEFEILDPAPQLKVALLTYGNSSNERDKGWVRIEVPLTSDLDRVSQRLFTLTTAGGAEFVSRALKTTVEDLSWTDDPGALKLVFIAGNESAEQDEKVDLRSTALDAFGNNLEVHAVFCGRPSNVDAEGWKLVADLADGEFAAIDPRAAALMVATPFDTKMAELGVALNQTYVPIGSAGREGLESQTAQDENASELGAAVSATRSQTKAGSLYSPEWDLVDALASGRVEFHEIPEEDLPEVMRQMTHLEREAYVEQQQVRREEIRQQIRELSVQRRGFVSGQIREKGLDEASSFDRVVRRAIRRQINFREPSDAD